MFSVIKISLLLCFALQTPKSDSLNIEQLAFNDFLLQIDSLQSYDNAGSKYFEKEKHKIYFSGKTGLYTSMPFVLNFRAPKRDFIIIDSLNDIKAGKDNWIYPLKGMKKIKVKSTFITIDKNNEQNKICPTGDLRIFMSNRYDYHGFYYIKFLIVSDNPIKTELYIKLDQNGRVVDRLKTVFVY